MLFCFLLFGWNEWNGDYDMYEEMYNYHKFFDLGYYEFGYYELSGFFVNNNFTFKQYLIVYSFIVIFLFYRVIYKLSLFPGLVAFFYLIIYFPLDYVLIRNTLAFGIISQGFILLFNNHKYKVLIYIVLVLFAWSIHFSSIIYLMFLFAFTEKKLNVKIISLYVVGSLIIYLFFRTIFIGIFIDANSIKFDVYNNSIIQFLLFSLFQIANFFIVSYLIGKRNETQYIYLFNINLLMLFLIIIYYDMTIFIRVFRNISFLNLIILSNVAFSENNLKKRIIFTLYMSLFFIGFIYPVSDKSIEPLYYRNFIFKDF